jgi:phage terminase large subunit
MEVKLTIPATKTVEALLHSEKRYIVNEGGARSGKTYGTMQGLIYYAHANAMTKITVVSHSLPHLKKGAMRDFLDIMDSWRWYDENEHNKTDNVYHFDNGSYIEFFGLEDAGKARGPGRHILFINEANLITKALFDQLDMRTTGKVIIDLNPADFDCWCYGLADGSEAVKIHSTYLDNPYLSKPQVSVIEAYREADETMWQVFGLGLRGTSREQIYTHWRLTDNIPEGAVFYGLDFGYNVQTALVRLCVVEGAAYVKQSLYKTKLTTNDLIEELKGLAIRNEEIFCDAAEPKTIEELYRAGFNVKPADKDVTEGIRKVKSLPLYIQKDSLDIIAEIKKYKWMVDKNEKVLDEPDKGAGHDHAMDAIRYAIFTKLKTPSFTWGVL